MNSVDASILRYRGHVRIKRSADGELVAFPARPTHNSDSILRIFTNLRVVENHLGISLHLRKMTSRLYGDYAMHVYNLTPLMHDAVV